MNPDISELLLVIHAFGGCDTVSGLYDKGKNAVLKLAEKSKSARENAKIFMKENASKEEISDAGNRLIKLLYGGEEMEV